MKFQTAQFKRRLDARGTPLVPLVLFLIFLWNDICLRIKLRQVQAPQDCYSWRTQHIARKELNLSKNQNIGAMEMKYNGP